MDITKHLLGFEGPEDDLRKFLAYIKKGDPRCKLKVGDRVVKIRKAEENEMSPVGSKGTIIGQTYNENYPEADKDCYWVKWDHHPLPTMVAHPNTRLQKLLES